MRIRTSSHEKNFREVIENLPQDAWEGHMTKEQVMECVEKYLTSMDEVVVVYYPPSVREKKGEPKRHILINAFKLNSLPTEKENRVKVSNKDKDFNKVIDSLPEDAWKNLSKKKFLNIIETHSKDTEITVFYYPSDPDFNGTPNLVYCIVSDK